MSDSFSPAALPPLATAGGRGTRRPGLSTNDLTQRVESIRQRVAVRQAEERRRNNQRFPYALECLSTTRSRFKTAFVEHCAENGQEAGESDWGRSVPVSPKWTPPKGRRPPRGLSTNRGNKYGDCGE